MSRSLLEATNPTHIHTDWSTTSSQSLRERVLPGLRQKLTDNSRNHNRTSCYCYQNFSQWKFSDYSYLCDTQKKMYRLTADIRDVNNELASRNNKEEELKDGEFYLDSSLKKDIYSSLR